MAEQLIITVIEPNIPKMGKDTVNVLNSNQMPNNGLESSINQNNMYRAKSLNDISFQRDRLKIINRENIKLNPSVKNRTEDINNSASMSRLVRRFSKFSPDKNSKSRGGFL